MRNRQADSNSLEIVYCELISFDMMVTQPPKSVFELATFAISIESPAYQGIQWMCKGTRGLKMDQWSLPPSLH